MGYFFTLLYLAAAYITPPVLFGPLSEFHVEIILVSLAVLTSIPGVFRSGMLRSPQFLAFAGMTLTVLISFLKIGWLGGAFTAFYAFMQPCFGFFLVAVNCRTKRHLQWIILALLLGSFYFIAAGIGDLQNHVIPSEFLYGDGDLRRLRGLGFVHDPNDLAQVLVSLIPAMFFWRQKNAAMNFLLIGIPTLFVLTGMFYTHSRGASLALAAVILVASRRKIGTVPAMAIAGILLAGTVALGWSGGRDVSMEAGADRLDLWYSGLDLIKANPFFGVGVGGFTERFGITAHNSVIICAAETGMVGLFFWVMLIFTTLRGGVLMVKTGALKKVDEDEELPGTGALRASVPAAAQESSDVDDRFAISGFDSPEMSEDAIRGMALILAISLTGFLVAGWFLSRAYSNWLFMYCGMMFAVLRMGRERGLQVKKDGAGFLFGWSAAITCGLIVLVSLILRFRNV